MSTVNRSHQSMEPNNKAFVKPERFTAVFDLFELVFSPRFFLRLFTIHITRKTC